MTKLTKERPKFFTPEETASLLTKLRESILHLNIECYVIGGFVRDGLMGQPNRDIDVTVTGDAILVAAEVAKAFGTKMVPLDEAHQIARVVLPQAGGHWHLDFATMRGSIEEDLSCRDFTINAIAISLAEITSDWSLVRVIDPLDGCYDLSRKIVRAASESSFQQDPVRLLRAVRLAAMLDFSIDPATETLMQRDHKLISTVAAERLRDELCFILETPRAYDSLRYLNDLCLLDLIVPELITAKGVTQPKEHFWDVFEHSLETVAAAERLLRQQETEKDDKLLAPVPWPPDIAQHFAQETAGERTRGALLKLACLLHDIGKPEAKTIEQDGRMRFLGHSTVGVTMAVQLMERLKFSNHEIKIVQLMIEHHLRPGYLVTEELPSRRAIYKYFRDTAEAGIDTLFLSLADHLAARGPMLEHDQWYKHTKTTQYILSKWFQEQTTIIPPKLIDGHTLMDKFGLVPGPQIGKLLEIVREAQAAGEIETVEEALNFVSKQLERNR